MRTGIGVVAIVAAMMVAACQAAPSEPTDQSSHAVESTSGDGLQPQTDGPHARADRPIAAPTHSSNAAGSVAISEVDLGNTTVGEYQAPVRGILVTPANAAGPAPLVVVNHLRAPNCADNQFAYPCPSGEEMRFDRGMAYLGESLAEQGFAVLIPDLTAMWVGADLTQPYDQAAMWQQTVGTLTDAIRDDAQGTTHHFAPGAAATIDLSTVGMVMHSRSAALVDAAKSLFGATKLRGVLAYGPAYDTFDPALFSPPPADVPYLAITGEQDLDVGPSANLWLSEYLSTPRTQPAMVASLPGFGHMLVNRTLAEAGIDDRVACDVVACPDGRSHERILSEVARDWFTTTMRGTPGVVSLGATDALPTTLGGVEARWLASSHGQSVVHLGPDAFTKGGDGTAQVCRHADLMNPVPIDHPCPEPERGVIQSASEVNHLTQATASTQVAGAKGLAIHLSPFGSHPDTVGTGTPVTLDLTLADGQHWTTTLDPSDPALRDRATTNDNGVYRMGTIRIPLPAEVTATTVQAITINAPTHPIELRGVDVIT